MSEPTMHSLSLAVIFLRSIKFKTEDHALETARNKYDAILIRKGASCQFAFEYELAQFLQSPPHRIFDVWFSDFRTDIGYSTKYMVMYSKKVYSLSAAVEVLENSFKDTKIYPIPNLDTPDYDLGSLYHYAIGKYRVVESNLKKPKTFISDLDRIVFTQPTLDNIYWETGAPLSLAKLWFPYLPEGPLESLWIFKNRSEMEPASKDPNHSLTLLEHGNPIVDKFWRTRGDLDLAFLKIYQLHIKDLERQKMTNEQVEAK